MALNEERSHDTVAIHSDLMEKSRECVHYFTTVLVSDISLAKRNYTEVLQKCKIVNSGVIYFVALPFIFVLHIKIYENKFTKAPRKEKQLDLTCHQQKVKFIGMYFLDPGCE